MHDRERGRQRQFLMRPGLVIAVAALLGGIQLAARPSDRLRTAAGSIEITPLIHATVQIEYAGKVVLVDPWSAADSLGVKRADLILITESDGNGDGHHMDVRELARVRKPGAPVVIPSPARKHVPDGVVVSNGESKAIAGVGIDVIPAHNPVAANRGPEDTHGYILTIAGKRLL